MHMMHVLPAPQGDWIWISCPYRHERRRSWVDHEGVLYDCRQCGNKMVPEESLGIFPSGVAFNINPKVKELIMADDIKFDGVKISPLDQFVRASAQMQAAQKAATFSGAFGNVSGSANGQVNINGKFYTVEQARAVADSIYTLLGEDE